MKEGFYYLSTPIEKDPVLVHGYNCTDEGGAFVFGFNTHDGGSIVRLDDLTKETTITPVDVEEGFSLRQGELESWQYKNFGVANPVHMALGMSEEVGEIAHHVLKAEQGIREGVDGINKEEIADGVADVLIYGIQLLSSYGIDAEEEIIKVIEKVLQRDWIKHPVYGEPVEGFIGTANPILNDLPFVPVKYISYKCPHCLNHTNSVKGIDLIVCAYSECGFSAHAKHWEIVE